MPKASSSSSFQQYARTMAAILSLSKVIPSPYSRYAKEGLLASPLSQQPSFYLECTKSNV